MDRVVIRRVVMGSHHSTSMLNSFAAAGWQVIFLSLQLFQIYIFQTLVSTVLILIDVLYTLCCDSVAAHRLDQGVDGDCPVTMTLPDLCYIVEPLVECDLPTFSVEIKVRTV